MKELIPVNKNSTAMDYSDPKKRKLVDKHAKIETSMIQDFFLEFLLNNNLGVISNAHLVQWDRSSNSLSDPRLRKLARLASIAVDYAKSGVPAEVLFVKNFSFEFIVIFG